ncbi:MAG TPA: hypothetical protein VGR30_00825 [Candidatus Binatia bacterium]|nr:hypothetical protein [Candidatus Binatia bacterium]
MKLKVRTKNQTGIREAFEEVVSRPLARRSFLKGALVTAPLLLVGPALLRSREAEAAQNNDIGPSTTTEPYMIPSIDDVDTRSILTVGDNIGGYRMVGIPDGLGALQSGAGEFTLLMNHEITAQRLGVVRAHGSNGAFVSRWTIDPHTLEVLAGEDLTPSPNHVFLWDPGTGLYLQGTTQWQRLCSADLPVERALFANGRGTPDRIFLDGEKGVPGHVLSRDPMAERPGSCRVLGAYPLRMLLPVRTPRTRRWLFSWMMAISVRPLSTQISQARFMSISAPRHGMDTQSNRPA